MTGRVDDNGRAWLTVELKPAPDAPAVRVATWIDTGFTGELVLPQSTIDQMMLPLVGVLEATLADGSPATMRHYRCYVHWFDELRALEVVANAGVYPLLGVGLLFNHDLRINYRSKTITLV